MARKSASSLVDDASLRPIAPFCLWLLLPACLWQGKDQSTAGQLCSVLCCVSRLGGVLGQGFLWNSQPTSGLLSQASSLRLPLGHSGWVLTLSNEICASLSSPGLLVGGCDCLGCCSTGNCCQARNLWVLIIYLFFLPVILPSEPKAHHRPISESVSWYLETCLFFKTPFPGWISIPTSFVSLFIFYILSYLLLNTVGCLSEYLMSSASIQKLFCGICWAFKCSFDEFVTSLQISAVQNPKNSWLTVKPPCSLVEDASLGLLLPLFQLWLPPPAPRLLISGREWASPQPVSSPLVCAQSFILQCLRLGLFAGQFSLSFCSLFVLSLSGYPTVWAAISGQFPQIALGIWPGLTLSNAARTSLFSPHLLVVAASTGSCCGF